MTELLQQAIAQIQKLPPDQQDAIAARFLAELQDEQKWETRFATTTDDHGTKWRQWCGRRSQQDKLFHLMRSSQHNNEIKRHKVISYDTKL